MTLLVKQELFKLIKKKSTAVLSVLLVVLLIGTALLAKKYTTIIDPVEMTAQLFSATSWIVFIMIAAASTIISMEAQKVFSRRNISKQMDHISYLFCLFIPFSYYCHCVDETDSFPFDFLHGEGFYWSNTDPKLVHLYFG